MTQPPPRISVVTPCRNGAEFLRACLTSVLDQHYPNLEYIVVDGGSTDGSVEIIREYAGRLAYWHSRPDRGQAHAINVGLGRATGEIVTYLNSDDCHRPDTLATVAAIFTSRPDVSVVFGDADFIDESGSPIRRYAGIDQPYSRKLQYWRGWDVPQPTVFLRRRVLDRHGVLDESLRYGLDYDWFLRVATTERFHHAGRVLAGYRLHAASKTGDWASTQKHFYRECRRAAARRLVFGSPAYWRWWLAYARDWLTGRASIEARGRRRVRDAITRALASDSGVGHAAR